MQKYDHGEKGEYGSYKYGGYGKYDKGEKYGNDYENVSGTVIQLRVRFILTESSHNLRSGIR